MENQKLPKHIKIKRNKKYTKIRKPYKTYQNAEWNWSNIFIEIDELKITSNTYLKDITEKYGMIYSTLANKYANYCKNTNKNNSLIDNENRGGSNKIFTSNEEEELYVKIKNKFIKKNKPLNNHMIKKLALNKFKEKDNGTNFTASDGWCNMFKKRWNLSTQKVKSSKIATNIPSDKDIKIFLNNFERSSKIVKKSLYLIMMKQVAI